MTYQYDEGKKGEDNTRFICGLYLKPPKYWCYHDLLVPYFTRTTQIDHVVVSKYGVFVLETKSMAGQIYGSASSQRWTQVVGSRKYQFHNPLKQNDTHLRILSNYLRLDINIFISVIIFWGNCRFKTEMPENVLWERAFVNYIRNKKFVQINHDQVTNATLALKNLINTTTARQRQHHTELFGNQKVCPLCGSRLIKHVVVKLDRRANKFLGCSNFPRCTFSRDIDS